MERSLQHVKTPEKQEGLRGSADCRLAIFNHQSFLVPSAGLEPAWVAPYAPQTYVSTNSTTTARERILRLRGSCGGGGIRRRGPVRRGRGGSLRSGGARRPSGRRR